MQHNVKVKRTRSENWLKEDKCLLKELVKTRIIEIENKSTNTESNRRKNAAWSDVLCNFNALCKGSLRTIAQLKIQWKIMKDTEKKRKLEKKDDVENKYESDLQGLELKIVVSDEQPSTNFSEDEQKMQLMNSPDASSYDPLEVEAERNTFTRMQSQNTRSFFKHNNKNGHTMISSVSNLTSEALEIQCRKELHGIQMRCERQRFINLKLKEELLTEKIKFYKNNMITKKDL